jgi:ATP-binding cassette, subfamily C, bacterial CydC
MGAAIQGAARIQEVASASADLLDPAVPVALPSEGVIFLDTLSFSYEDLAAAAVPVLRDVDLRVEIGERIAIVGPSGSGKSTLLHLLLRLEDSVAGSVNFGGCDAWRALSSLRLRGYIGPAT